MRLTKNNLLAALDKAGKFNQIPLRLVSPTQEAKLRDEPWFVAACQYGPGMLPLIGEIGVNVRDRERLIGADSIRKGEIK